MKEKLDEQVKIKREEFSRIFKLYDGFLSKE